MSSIFLIAIQVDTAAPHIMAQSAFEPIGLYDPDDQFHLRHPDNEYPQDIEDPNHQTASILRNVVTKQNGNTNPSHHAVLFLSRADLENDVTRSFQCNTMTRYDPTYSNTPRGMQDKQLLRTDLLRTTLGAVKL